MDRLFDKLKAMSSEDKLYRLRNLSAHLIAAGHLERLHLLLTNFKFIEAKCKEGMTYELLNDYNAGLEAVSITKGLEKESMVEFRNFVRAETHILHPHPELTFQQAANQPEETAPALQARNWWESHRETRSWIRWLNKPNRRADLLTIRIPQKRLLCAAVSDDRQVVVVGSDSGNLFVFDLTTGEEVSRNKLSNLPIMCICFTHNTNDILVATSNGAMSLCNIRTGICYKTWHHHTAAITSMTLNGSRTQLLTAGEDGTVCLWKWDQKEQLSLSLTRVIVPEEPLPILSAAFILYDTAIAIGTVDGALRLLEVKSHQGEFYQGWKHNQAMTCCTAGRDGTLLWTGSMDHTIRCFKVSNNLEVKELRGVDCGQEVSFIGFADEPLSCIVGLRGGGVHKITLSSDQMKVDKYYQHLSSVILVALTPDIHDMISVEESGLIVRRENSPEMVDSRKHKLSRWKDIGWISNGKFLYTLFGKYLGKGMQIIRHGQEPEMRLSVFKVPSFQLVKDKILVDYDHFAVQNELCYFLTTVNDRINSKYGVQIIEMPAMDVIDLLEATDEIEKIVTDNFGPYCLVFEAMHEASGKLTAWDLYNKKPIWNKVCQDLIQEIWIDSQSDCCGYVAQRSNRKVKLKLATGEDITDEYSPKQGWRQPFQHGFQIDDLTSTLIFFEADTNTYQVVFDPEYAYITWFHAVGENQVVVATEDGLIQYMDITGKIVSKLEGNAWGFNPYVINQYVVSISSDYWLRVWDFAKGEVVMRLPISKETEIISVESIEQLVVLGLSDGEFVVYKLEIGKQSINLEDLGLEQLSIIQGRTTKIADLPIPNPTDQKAWSDIESSLTQKTGLNFDSFASYGANGVTQIFLYGAHLIKYENTDASNRVTSYFDHMTTRLPREMLIRGMMTAFDTESPEMAAFIDRFNWGSRFSVSRLLLADKELSHIASIETMLWAISHDYSPTENSDIAEEISRFIESLFFPTKKYTSENSKQSQEPEQTGRFQKLLNIIQSKFLKRKTKKISANKADDLVVVSPYLLKPSVRDAAIECVFRLSIPNLMPLLVQLIADKIEKGEIHDPEFHRLVQALIRLLYWPREVKDSRFLNYFEDGLTVVLKKLPFLPVITFGARRMQKALKHDLSTLRDSLRKDHRLSTDSDAVMRDILRQDYFKLHAWVDRRLANNDFGIILPDFVLDIITTAEKRTYKQYQKPTSKFLAELECYNLRRRNSLRQTEFAAISPFDLEKYLATLLLRSGSTSPDTFRIINQIPALISPAGLHMTRRLLTERKKILPQKQLLELQQEIAKRLNQR